MKFSKFRIFIMKEFFFFFFGLVPQNVSRLSPFVNVCTELRNLPFNVLKFQNLPFSVS